MKVFSFKTVAAGICLGSAFLIGTLVHLTNSSAEQTSVVDNSQKGDTSVATQNQDELSGKSGGGNPSGGGGLSESSPGGGEGNNANGTDGLGAISGGGGLGGFGSGGFGGGGRIIVEEGSGGGLGGFSGGRGGSGGGFDGGAPTESGGGFGGGGFDDSSEANAAGGLGGNRSDARSIDRSQSARRPMARGSARRDQYMGSRGHGGMATAGVSMAGAPSTVNGFAGNSGSSASAVMGGGAGLGDAMMASDISTPQWLSAPNDGSTDIESLKDRVREQLGTLIDLNTVASLPLKEAIAKITTDAELAIIFDPSIEDLSEIQNSVQEGLVFGKIQPLPLRAGLQILLRNTDCAFIIEPGLIRIVDRQQAAEHRSKRFYDLALVLSSTDDSDSLVDSLKSVILTAWDDDGGSSTISLHGSLMIVAASDAVHFEIEEVLRAVAKAL